MGRLKKVLLLSVGLISLSSTPEAKPPERATEATHLLGQFRGTLLLTQWDVGEDTLLAVVREDRGRASVEPPQRILTFYSLDKEPLKEVYRYETMDVPLAAFATAETRGNLVTIWVGGSALHVIVFHYGPGGPRLALEAGSRAFPELVRVGQGGEPVIITSDGYYRVDAATGATHWEWTTASIFQWVGQEYVETRTAYPTRLSEITKLPVRGSARK